MKIIDKLALLNGYNYANNGNESAQKFCERHQLDWQQPTFAEALEVRTLRIRTKAGLPT